MIDLIRYVTMKGILSTAVQSKFALWLFPPFYLFSNPGCLKSIMFCSSMVINTNSCERYVNTKLSFAYLLRGKFLGIHWGFLSGGAGVLNAQWLMFHLWLLCVKVFRWQVLNKALNWDPEFQMAIHMFKRMHRSAIFIILEEYRRWVQTALPLFQIVESLSDRMWKTAFQSYPNHFYKRKTNPQGVLFTFNNMWCLSVQNSKQAFWRNVFLLFEM